MSGTYLAPIPTAPAVPWEDVTARYWAGHGKWFGASAHEARFGMVTLLLVRDSTGWMFKVVGLFGETRLDEKTFEEAAEAARMILHDVLCNACEKLAPSEVSK